MMGEPLRRSQAAQTGGPTVAGECAAYLSGDYLDYIREAGALGSIPRAAWMMLNPIAHGSPERVRRLAGMSVPVLHHKLTWHQCRARIAAALVGKCWDDDNDLTRLQRDALVPLELALIDEVDVTPQMLVQLSLLALEVQTFEES